MEEPKNQQDTAAVPKPDSPAKDAAQGEESSKDLVPEDNKPQNNDADKIVPEEEEKKKPKDSPKQETQNQADSASANAVAVVQPEEAKAVAQVKDDPKAPKLYFYGSCECDQFYIGEDRFEAKRPIELTSIFTSLDKTVYSVVCGALHTLILLTNGEVYSLGCNDDGALGRSGEDNRPEKVDLPVPVDMISAGDSHSIACNSANGIVYQWGVYRNALSGKLSEVEPPHRIGESDFNRKKIKKLLSGANHTMVLIDDKVHIWGDPEGGALGRTPTDRRKTTQGLAIAGLGIRGIQDIFTAAYHSFIIRKNPGKKDSETSVLAWGLNNHGQLGLGHVDNTVHPTEIEAFEGKNIKSIVGGEHHTIALTEEGEVYGFGKNDEGQLGLGEDYEPEPEPEEEDEEEAKEEGEGGTVTAAAAAGSGEGEGEAKGEEKKNEPEKMDEEVADKGDKMVDEKDEKGKKNEKDEKDEKETKKPKAPKKVREVKEPVKGTKERVIKPVKLKIGNINEIFSGSNYCYAVDKEQQAYAWGMGDLYVLGNKEEETIYQPEKINEPFFRAKPLTFSLGTQHVACVCITDEGEPPVLDDAVSERQTLKKVGQATPAKEAPKKEEVPKKEEGEKEEARGRSKQQAAKKTPEKSKAKKSKNDENEEEEEKEEKEEKAPSRTSQRVAKKTPEKSKGKKSKDEEIDEEEVEEKSRSRSRKVEKKDTKKDSKKATKKDTKKVTKSEEKSQPKGNAKSKKEEPKATKGQKKAAPPAAKKSQKRKLNDNNDGDQEDLKKVKKTTKAVQPTKARSKSRKGSTPAKKEVRTLERLSYESL